MSRLGRNLQYRNRVGIGSIFIFVVWALVVVGIWGMQVTVKQRMGDARHRIESMQAEMDRLADKIESLRTQEAVLLGRDAIKRRLQASESELEPISLDRVHYIKEQQEVEMAMRRNGAGGSR